MTMPVSFKELLTLKGVDVTQDIQTQLSDKATNPMTASGDIIYGGASGTPTRLAKGTDDQVLTLASGVPTWADATGGGGATVYFDSYLSANQTGINMNNSAIKIAFNTTTVNVGSGFNTSNNRFEVPSDGVYDFGGYFETSTANIATNQYYYMWLYVDGAVARKAGGPRPAASTIAVTINGNFPPISLTTSNYVELYLYSSADHSSSTITMGGGITLSHFWGKKIA